MGVFHESYHRYSLPAPHDSSDIFKVMGSKVKVTDNFFRKCTSVRSLVINDSPQRPLVMKTKFWHIWCLFAFSLYQLHTVYRMQRKLACRKGRRDTCYEVCWNKCNKNVRYTSWLTSQKCCIFASCRLLNLFPCGMYVGLCMLSLGGKKKKKKPKQQQRSAKNSFGKELTSTSKKALRQYKSLG